MSGPAAVLFDLGGVVFDSPLALIGEFEVKRSLPQHFVARMVGGYGGDQGAWQRLERGELSLAAFCEQFDRDAAALGHPFSSTELMRDLLERADVRPVMLEAIRRLRRAGFRVGALTNNWVTDDAHDERLAPLREEFHVFIESCKVGLRKPEPAIFRLACDAVGLPPADTVFLDDIGVNLKAAKALGMSTIKVGEPTEALRELSRVVGIELV